MNRPPHIAVRLTDSELNLAAAVGCERRIHMSSRHRDKDRAHGMHGRGGEERLWGNWNTDIIGSMAEIAFAKWSGLFWNGRELTTGRRPDVGPWQVRASMHEDGPLHVYLKDSPGDPFVLVVPTELPMFHIMGWVRGADVMRPMYLHEYPNGAAYRIAQQFLRTMTPEVARAGGLMVVEETATPRDQELARRNAPIPA